MRYDFDDIDDYTQLPVAMAFYRTEFMEALGDLDTAYKNGILDAIENRFVAYKISEPDNSDWAYYMKRRLRLNKDYFKRVLDKYFQELNEADGYSYTKTSTTGTTSNSSGNSSSTFDGKNTDTNSNSNTVSGSNGNSKDTTHIELPNKQTQREYPNDKLNEDSTGTYSENGSGTENKHSDTNYTDDKEFNQDNTSEENFSETRKGGVNVIDQRERMLKYIRNIYYDFTELFKDLVLQVYL